MSQGRGLAGTITAKQGEYLALLDAKVDTIQYSPTTSINT